MMLFLLPSVFGYCCLAAALPQAMALKTAPAQEGPMQKGPTQEERLLNAHNGERARLGMQPLAWSPQLTRDARVWALTLAEKDIFEHAPPSKDDQGENLWMGTKGRYSPEEMVGAWIDERALYKPGKFPNVATNGIWQDVGHYTQLIWHNTTEVGCAVAANAESDYLVCRYNPPGNWEGQYAEGLSPLK